MTRWAERLWLTTLAATALQLGALAWWWRSAGEETAYHVAAPPPASAGIAQGVQPDSVRVQARRPAKRAPTAGERARDRVVRLRQAFAERVGGHSLTPAYRRHLRLDLRRRLLTAEARLGRSQWLVYVDRSPRRQALTLWYYDQPADRFLAVGATRISTGAPFRGRGTGERDPHFLTPTGVFRDTPRFGDYRALNVAGRVFDFGRVRSATWRPGRHRGQVARRDIHFQAHVGEGLGAPASHGCIRMQADLNRFLHQRGVWDHLLAGHWKWALVHGEGPADPPALAGQYLVVGDSCLRFEACADRYRGLLARLGHRPVGGAGVSGSASPTAVAQR